MKRSTGKLFLRRIGVLGLLVSLIAGAVSVPTGVSAQQPAYSARIITGTCDAPGAQGLVDLPALNETDDEAGFAFSSISFQTPWVELTNQLLAQPAVVIVYKGTSVDQSVQSNWVLCGAIDQTNVVRNDAFSTDVGNRNLERESTVSLVVALGEVNRSAMAGAFRLQAQNEDAQSGTGTIVALEDAIVHWTPQPDPSGVWDARHRFAGSRGTCQAPSTEWWQFRPFFHTGPLALSESYVDDTQISNFNGGPHFFSVYNSANEEDTTLIACGDAVGDERTAENAPEGFLSFRLHEMNNSGYVGFVMVYDAAAEDFLYETDYVFIDAFVFPGARR